jgi:hypothetical protein
MLIFRFDMILVIIHAEGWPSSMTIVGVSVLVNSSFLDVTFIYFDRRRGGILFPE